MLTQIRRQLGSRDVLLLGTDLVKDQSILLPAYVDAQGVTEQFNKNILLRLNRELGADFNLNFFRHVASWNPQQSRIEIYLESLRPQLVAIPSLNLCARFANGERIHTENSYKYWPGQAEALFEATGFAPISTWSDPRGWFAVCLGRAS